jgi:polysaccharide pyruvyl transferase WcaK-like protein
VSYLSQGFGPVTGRLWRHLTVETLRSARRFVARDEETARVLREEGLQNVEQAADWCWLAPTAREPRSPNSEIVVVPCARHLPPRNLLDADSLVVAVERHSASFIYAFGRRHRLRWTDATTLEGWNSVTSRARIVVSARYHALVLALMAGIPVVAVGTDPKIRSLALQFSLCWYPDYDALPRPLHQMAPPVPPSDKLIAVKLLAEKNEEYLKDVTARD